MIVRTCVQVVRRYDDARPRLPNLAAQRGIELDEKHVAPAHEFGTHHTHLVEAGRRRWIKEAIVAAPTCSDTCSSVAPPQFRFSTLRRVWADAIRAVIAEAGLLVGDELSPWPPVVFYQLPVNVNTASAETIAARFGVSLELAKWMVESRHKP